MPSKQGPHAYKHIQMHVHEHMDADMDENMYYLYNQNSDYRKNTCNTFGRSAAYLRATNP